MNDEQTLYRDFDKIRFWVQTYALGDVDDQRSIENFIICESDEMVRPLQSQLYMVAKGGFDEEWMDKQVGLKRKVKYGSWENWARLMLQWIYEAKKRA
ncbi:MAG: hypothetical protein K1X83_08090 [Oligoflexia bacterium]|nr:hypothetical protein [Oligoflexia bacterium]